MGSLIIHPDVLDRRRRIEELRMELAVLFDEYARLAFEELPALRHRYGELFGAIERRTQQRMLELRQRRRMVELFAIKIDRGQKLDAKMVELVMRAVMNESAEVRSRMNRSLSYRDAGEMPPGADSPRQRGIQAREIYRRLARRLHPDARGLHDARGLYADARGGSDPVARRYWDVVQQAYLRCDLEMLRALEQLVHEIGAGAELPVDALAAEQRRLVEAIASERRRVAALRDIEPYTLRDSLRDEAWIAERRALHEAELAEIDREIDACNRFLDPIFETVKASADPVVVENLWHDFVERMYFNR